MKILVLSFYYQPDLCAGSFRTTALIRELKKYTDLEIDILTTMPNRYASFGVEALEEEIHDNVTTHRIILPSHKSGILDQIMSFKTYYFHVMQMVKNEKYDLKHFKLKNIFFQITHSISCCLKNK